MAAGGVCTELTVRKSVGLHLHCCLSPQRPNWIPKDIHVEPERFAAELIGRLEGVLRAREAEEKLEERLQRVRLVRSLDSMNWFVTFAGHQSVIRQHTHTQNPPHTLTPGAYLAEFTFIKSYDHRVLRSSLDLDLELLPGPEGVCVCV